MDAAQRAPIHLRRSWTSEPRRGGLVSCRRCPVMSTPSIRTHADDLPEQSGQMRMVSKAAGQSDTCQRLCAFEHHHLRALHPLVQDVGVRWLAERSLEGTAEVVVA
jgi:hypothetical protein